MAVSTAVTQTGQEGLVEAVVSAVADQTDADPLSLEPLYHTIDPETIDASTRVTFTYEGCDVVIDTDGVVHVSDAN